MLDTDQANEVTDAAQLCVGDARERWGVGWEMLSQPREDAVLAACLRAVLKWPRAQVDAAADLARVALRIVGGVQT